MSDVSSSPASSLVAEAWGEFERSMLKEVSSELPPPVRSLCRASFYFGCLAMVQLLEAALEEARHRESLPLTLRALAEEIEGFMAAQEERAH